MAIYHQVPLQVFPFIEEDRLNESRTTHTHMSPLCLGSFASSSASSTSEICDVKGDLLTDLWQTNKLPASSISTQSTFSAPISNNMWNSAISTSASPTFSSTMDTSVQDSSVFGNNYIARDPSMEYARSLLPNNLLGNTLPALTEENLYSFSTNETYSATSSLSEPSNDEMFNFEQQQLQIQHQPPLKNCPSHKSSSVNTQLYKTELCASYIKTGVCPYGNKCQFAHGENELKIIERSPKWRSKPCANWSKFGSCRYGNRCCFKHGN